MRCREQTCHRATFGGAKKIGALDANSVHHRADIVGVLFKCRHPDGPVGQPGTALVESNQATEAAEPLVEERAARNLPIEIKVRHRPRRHDYIDRPFAPHLVGDQHIVTAGVLRLG
jgi:hypothetical protein